MDNRINLTNSEIKNILSIIRNKNNKYFRFYIVSFHKDMWG